jgi:hypothetical protein
MHHLIRSVTVRAAAVAFVSASAAFAQWNDKSPATSPSARSGAAMAFHFGLGQMLLFGGSTPLVNGETWAYDGSDWALLSPLTSPTARTGAQMVYDQARGVAVLYGGLASNITIPPPNNDTWEFDGVNWTQAAPTGNAGARYQYGACYDALRSRTVLFGGATSQLVGTPNSQTWEYDGITWSLVTTVGNPGPRNRPAMCFHPVLGKAVMFGGSDSSGPTDSTWLYDGTAATWTEVTIVGPRPSVRNGAALAYDPVRNLCVMHGGQNTAGPLADTWTFDGATWTLQPAQLETVRDLSLAFFPPSGKTLKFGGFVAGPGFLSGATREFGSGVLGAGCAGTNGVPGLVTATAPLLGQDYTLDVDNMNPAINIAAVAFGFTQLPGIDLSILGMPGCLAYTSADLLVTVVGTGGSGSFTWQSVFGLVGDSFYVQALCLDPAVNAFGFSISNAVFATIGS